ncbi:hypothetical protein D9M71_92910 [compost metagenome]
MHGDRLVHRQGIGCLRCGRLGQRCQTVGEIIDTGVAAGGLEVLQAVIDQAAESLVAPLTGAAVVALNLQHGRHAGGKVLRRRQLTVSLGLRLCRCSLGLRLAGSRYVTALLHRQAHRWQCVERIGRGIEIAVGSGQRWSECSRSRSRSRSRGRNRRINDRLHCVDYARGYRCQYNGIYRCGIDDRSRVGI